MTKRGSPVAAVLAALAMQAALPGCTTETKTQYLPVTPPASTYLVEYLPGMMDATAGKSSFQLRVRKRSDFSAATGLSLSVKATMDMGAMRHGTPVDVVVESSTQGTYDVTAYYLMADMGMGYWALDVTIPLASGTETHTFYPSVGMAMGPDTWRQSLYGPADVGMGGGEMAIDKYYLFTDGPVSAAAPALALYLTRSGNMVTTFTPVASAVLTASADAAFTAPVTGTHGANGHWTIPLTGFALTAGTPATVYVKLAVGGEAKTTHAASGDQAYATFQVTPH